MNFRQTFKYSIISILFIIVTFIIISFLPNLKYKKNYQKYSLAHYIPDTTMTLLIGVKDKEGLYELSQNNFGNYISENRTIYDTLLTISIQLKEIFQADLPNKENAFICLHNRMNHSPSATLWHYVGNNNFKKILLFLQKKFETSFKPVVQELNDFKIFQYSLPNGQFFFGFFHNGTICLTQDYHILRQSIHSFSDNKSIEHNLSFQQASATIGKSVHTILYNTNAIDYELYTNNNNQSKNKQWIAQELSFDKNKTWITGMIIPEQPLETLINKITNGCEPDPYIFSSRTYFGIRYGIKELKSFWKQFSNGKNLTSTDSILMETGRGSFNIAWNIVTDSTLQTNKVITLYPKDSIPQIPSILTNSNLLNYFLDGDSIYFSLSEDNRLYISNTFDATQHYAQDIKNGNTIALKQKTLSQLFSQVGGNVNLLFFGNGVLLKRHGYPSLMKNRLPGCMPPNFLLSNYFITEMASEGKVVYCNTIMSE